MRQMHAESFAGSASRRVWTSRFRGALIGPPTPEDGRRRQLLVDVFGNPGRHGHPVMLAALPYRHRRRGKTAIGKSPNGNHDQVGRSLVLPINGRAKVLLELQL